LTNEDVADLFSRVDVGTRVVVLPKSAPRFEAKRLEARDLEAKGLEAKRTITVRPGAASARPIATTSGRQAMNLSTSTLY
jgi:hypothetical protein